MTDKDLALFAQTIGQAFLQLKTQLDSANERLEALGEPVINVEAPSVALGDTNVTFDTEAIVAALTAFSTEGVEAGLSAVAEAIGGIQPTEVDTASVVAAIEANQTPEAVRGLAERMDELAASQERNSQVLETAANAIIAMADQMEKVGSATGAQFTSILETISAENQMTRDAIKAVSGPKEIELVNDAQGRPFKAIQKPIN